MACTNVHHSAAHSSTHIQTFLLHTDIGTHALTYFPCTQDGLVRPFLFLAWQPMHVLFHCIWRKISRPMLSWQVESSSSYQAERLFLEILNRPLGFRKILFTLEEKVLWYMGFLSTGKRKIELERAVSCTSKRVLARKTTDWPPFSSSEAFLDGYCVWFFALFLPVIHRSTGLREAAS